MITSIKHWLSVGSYKSLLIMTVGFVIQVVSWFILFDLIASNVGNEPIQQLGLVASVVWCALPLFSIVGLLAGIAYQRRHGFSLLAIVGMILNGIWFLMAAFAFFMVFIVGVTA